VRYKTNDYSVPVASGRSDVWIGGHVDEVVIGCGGTHPPEHPFRIRVVEYCAVPGRFLHRR
jgi:hypothetical protein